VQNSIASPERLLHFKKRNAAEDIQESIHGKTNANRISTLVRVPRHARRLSRLLQYKQKRWSTQVQRPNRAASTVVGQVTEYQAPILGGQTAKRLATNTHGSKNASVSS
jgi:hypothetical protein